jgi:hypothetical protein
MKILLTGRELKKNLPKKNHIIFINVETWLFVVVVHQQHSFALNHPRRSSHKA